jgi:hypothetical protein
VALGDNPSKDSSRLSPCLTSIDSHFFGLLHEATYSPRPRAEIIDLFFPLSLLAQPWEPVGPPVPRVGPNKAGRSKYGVDDAQ